MSVNKKKEVESHNAVHLSLENGSLTMRVAKPARDGARQISYFILSLIAHGQRYQGFRTPPIRVRVTL